MPLDPVDPSLRAAELRDVDQMVAIHLQAFPRFFLTILGRRFLVELYHSILADESGVVLVNATAEKILGFVAGTVAPANFYGRLVRQRWPRFALAALVPAIRQPSIIPRLLRALRKPAEEPASPGGALLMSLAVDPAAQRSGIGVRLVAGFSVACQKRGVDRIRLTTDRADNAAVNSFYLRNGFRLDRMFTTPEGRTMNEYVLDLPRQTLG